MIDKEVVIKYTTFEHIDALTKNDQELCRAAATAYKTAYAPYSRFKVGCAVQLTDGEVICGSNQENVAYPSGLCAERSALFAVGSKYSNAVVKSMAITAQSDNFKITHPVTSCGACLQVMAEFEKRQKSPIEVIFYCEGGEVIKVHAIKDLLPFGFVEERLEG